MANTVLALEMLSFHIKSHYFWRHHIDSIVIKPAYEQLEQSKGRPNIMGMPYVALPGSHS